MGIWATWVGVGSFIMYNLAPQLEHSFGWQSVWWTGSGLAVIALLLFIVFMRLPADACIRCEDSSIRSIEPDQLQFAAVLGNRDIWLLGLEFGCFNITFTGFLTYFPTFLSDVRDFSLSHASFVASLVTLAGLVSAPLSGLLSDRIGSRRLLITVPFLLIAGLWVFPFQVTEWALYAFVVALGVLSLAIATATFAAVPEVIASPNQTGMGLAVIALFANIGILTGPLLVGKMVETVGWVFTGYWLIPICVFGALVARAIKVR